MSDIGKKLDDVLNLSLEEQSIIYKTPKKKFTRFEAEIIEEATRKYQLQTTSFPFNALSFTLNEAIKQAYLLLLKFPPHEKPPQHVFINTISAFISRRATHQFEYDVYYKWNVKDLNVAKLHVEYSTFIKYTFELLQTLQESRSFKQFQTDVDEMLELEKFLDNLEKENMDKTELLRKHEMYLIKLCQSNIISKELKVLDQDYDQVENEYHDTRIIRARQLRFNKNLFNAQLDQIKKRQSIKSNDLTDETNEFLRNYDVENVVFEESNKYNLIMIDELKEEIQQISQKYDNDLIQVEFEISKVQSELNYFEEWSKRSKLVDYVEMWEQKQKDMKLMKEECHNYIESVRQRKREEIAKRLAQPWIASARKTIDDQKKKAKRLARKNKKKK